MQQLEMKLHKLSDEISKLENRLKRVEEILEQKRIEEVFKLGELTP